ncbi:restriction endonuclease subunit S [Comamonas sp. JUb58]|uniref:restriction endonuclease subunit S n=1 Tax=Comamonas sp. JUb58 TaxID=2485114 RepID=UPI0010F288C1|nr:restriction endonuclease subunit S [Comamonas sp. JUb58]TDS69605.1 type I restriction enzyme S subunit [Comamonas sp. JUb58]
MSNVNFLEKLLDVVAVEWKPLGLLGELVRGNGLQKKDFTETGVPAIHYGQIYTYYGLSTKKTKSFVSPELAKQLKKVNTGDVVITNTSENLEDVGKALVYFGEQQAVTGGHATIFKPGNYILGKYFVYFTQAKNFPQKKENMQKAQKLLMCQLRTSQKIKIPIPCPANPEKSLEIQAEIVRILDAMTAHTAELTARNKQYNYYRDKFLSFEDEEVEWKATEDVFEIFAGGDVPKDEFSESQTDYYNIPILSNEIDGKALYGWTNKAKIENPILTVSARGTIGWTSYRTQPFFPIVRLIVLTPKININLKYAYYFMKTIEKDYKVAESGIPQLTKPMIKDIKIPIPYSDNKDKSLKEQARIVAILDKFDALTTSLTEGLPREIELRQKQYAHYRDLLLSFPKPETV